VEHKGELLKIIASFVVGCDGAHSQVRHALHLPLEGGEYDAPFMLADIETVTSLPRTSCSYASANWDPSRFFR